MYIEKRYKQRITLGQGDNTLVKLIAICLVVFVGLAFMKAVWYFTYNKDLAIPLFQKNILSWFTMPADLNKLASRPWTVLTHMFTHDNVWVILANMLWLWSFGYIMQDLTGNSKIIPLFIYGALAGAIAFLLSYNLIPSLRPLLPYATAMGATAGVMSVAVGTTMLSPGYRLFPMIRGGIPLWVLTVVYLFSHALTTSVRDTGTILFLVAGAFAGILFIYALRQGRDLGAWMNNFFEWFGNLFNPHKPKKGKPIKEELFYKATAAPFKKTSNITQQRVDEILDKINQKGYHSLSDEEKELLKRASSEEL